MTPVREHLQAVLRVDRVAGHPLVFARRAFEEAGVRGYKVASGRMSETFTDLLVVTLAANVERSPLGVEGVRRFYETILRDAFVRVSGVRFVRVDWVREVPGRSLARDVSRVLEEARGGVMVERIMKGERS